MKLDLFKDLKKKQKNKLKRKIMKVSFLAIVIIITVIVSLKVIINIILKMPSLNVTKVILQGSSFSTEEAARYCNIDLPVNIFRVNISSLATDVESLHPELKKVVVRRRPPDTLLVEIERRKPVAEIEVKNRYYRIDKVGFILPSYAESPSAELPDIVGVRNSLILASLLRVSESKRLQDALEILKLLKKTGVYEKYKVNTIDVSNYRNPTFTIDGGVEVKIETDKLEQQIKVLSKSLPSIKLDEVKYIDLRFNDIIIGTK